MIDLKGIDLNLGEKELKDLPLSVLQELKFSGAKRQQVLLLIISDNGGAASLDQLLVRYWRKTEIELTRQQMVATLHRMADKGYISRVEGKQGVYAVQEKDHAKTSLTESAASNSELLLATS